MQGAQGLSDAAAVAAGGAAAAAAAIATQAQPVSPAEQQQSPYVHGKFNARYGYGKRQGNNSGRLRPQTKALKLAEQQAVDFAVPSLAAQGASAPGPPQSRLMGRGQLDRETPTETTTCKHAIAQLQVCGWERAWLDLAAGQ